MNASDFQALLPILVPGITSLVLLLVIAFFRNNRLATGITLAGLALAGYCLAQAADSGAVAVGILFTVDGFSLVFIGLTLAAAILITLLASGSMEDLDFNREEFYVLLLLATCGACALAASSHFVSLFLALELLTVPIYAMVAYRYRREESLEAGVKYLVLAALSSAFLLFGMALIYGELGTMRFSELLVEMMVVDAYRPAMVLTGSALMLVGIGFKLSLVPFHMWTPDIYQGASAPVGAFLATISKGAVVAVTLRFFIESGAYHQAGLMTALSVIAVATMFFGNLLALLQTNVKRLLGYSSIAHMGYMLVAFIVGGLRGSEAVTFYLFTYFVTSLGAFGAIAVLSRGEEEPDTQVALRGMARRHPMVGALMTFSMLSLAGVPLTAGFLGKAWVLSTGVLFNTKILVGTLIVSSAIGLYYYLRVILNLYARDAEPAIPVERVPLAGAVALGVAGVTTLWLGLYPTPVLELIRLAVAGL
ncbi:MAG: NADH-quinone oxidoreductase subunit N [Opitutales bacterium]